ncbi:hypothetical protein Tco_1542391, partial [Tanacetum coccineum]
LGKLQPTADIGIFISYAPSRKGYRIYNKRTQQIMETFGTGTGEGALPMWKTGQGFSTMTLSISPAPAVSAPVNSAGTPSSTIIDQDAPSPSHSPSSSVLQSPSLHQGVVADSTLIEDNPFAIVDNHPFINVFALEPSSEASSSGDLSSSKSPYVSQTVHHLGKWTHWIILLAMPIGRYPPENNWQPMPYGACITLYY